VEGRRKRREGKEEGRGRRREREDGGRRREEGGRREEEGRGREEEKGGKTYRLSTTPDALLGHVIHLRHKHKKKSKNGIKTDGPKKSLPKREKHERNSGSQKNGNRAAEEVESHPEFRKSLVRKYSVVNSGGESGPIVNDR
jgi:hypothetical protein